MNTSSRMSARKYIVDIMVQQNVSAASAILHKYPELGAYQAFEQTPDDLALISYLSDSKTPPLRLMDNICKQTGFERLFVQRLLAGDGTDRAKNALYKRQASSGGKEEVKARVNDLQTFIDTHLKHPQAPYYPQSTASAFNNKLGLPNDPAENRVKHFVNESNITMNDFAWLLYDASSLSAKSEAGARIVTRRMMNTEFNEKHPVMVSFSETSVVRVCRRDETVNRNKSMSNALQITIPRGMTPAEYTQSDIMALCERELDSIYAVSGYKSYRAYLEDIKLKKAEDAASKAKKKAFRKTVNNEGLYAALKLHQDTKDLSTILDVTNRHIKDRKTCSYLFAQKVYLTKSNLLVGAVKCGDASVVRLVKRPNPFMLNETDMLPIDDVIQIVESIFSGEHYSFYSTKASISEMFNHFAESGIVAIENNTIIPIADRLTYTTTFVRYLLAINSESMASALAHLFANKTQVLDCFHSERKKEKLCGGRWINMDKHFKEDYANVWEISFDGHVFHLPYLSMPKWDELDVEVTQTSYSKIGGRSVTQEENEIYPFELCLEKIGYYAVSNLNSISY